MSDSNSSSDEEIEVDRVRTASYTLTLQNILEFHTKELARKLLIMYMIILSTREEGRDLQETVNRFQFTEPNDNLTEKSFDELLAILNTDRNRSKISDLAGAPLFEENFLHLCIIKQLSLLIGINSWEELSQNRRASQLWCDREMLTLCCNIITNSIKQKSSSKSVCCSIPVPSNDRTFLDMVTVIVKSFCSNETLKRFIQPIQETNTIQTPQQIPKHKRFYNWLTWDDIRALQGEQGESATNFRVCCIIGFLIFAAACCTVGCYLFIGILSIPIQQSFYAIVNNIIGSLCFAPAGLIVLYVVAMITCRIHKAGSIYFEEQKNIERTPPVDSAPDESIIPSEEREERTDDSSSV
jgi:hypothetical protein